MNILTTPFDTKYQTAPFAKIETSFYRPAFKQAIAMAREEIDSIVNQTAAPTFDNTIAALDFSGETLDRLSSIFFNLNAAETSDEIQQIAQEVSPWLTEFSNDITLNPRLFARIEAVYKSTESASLTAEQRMLLEKKYKHFVRNGALLSEIQKGRLREIDTALAKLKLTFGEHVLAETHDFELHITNQDDLSGLPPGVIEGAALLAKEREVAGWIFTLDHPSYMPFVTYADRRELRKKITLASGARAFRNNQNDNRELVKQIALLRFERANLLGYATHAAFVLEERMAQTPAQVSLFLSDLSQKALPAARKEFNQLTLFARQRDGIDVVQKWDGPYYSEKMRQELFQLDDEMLKPYFNLSYVLEGAFAIANKLFGIQFKEIFDVDKYHDEVQTFKVVDKENQLVAIFYADFFPRKGKRNGAWMTSYKPQFIKDGVNHRPHVSIVCNFTRPTQTKPSLLSFSEVTTLFHEFGHALHGMLANTTYPSLSGTNVYWDFVELPSQIMENWCYEPEALSIFAKHYETGEIIPQDYVDKIKKSATFMEGMATLRQLSFGMLDMAYHAADPAQIKDIKAFEDQAFATTKLYPDVAENCMSVSFSHIFQGGYSAGYYSYKWAEVLDADAFEYFKEFGIFNKEVATKLAEHILSKGGTEHPMELYKRFRGKKPSPEALLRRAGLL